MGVGPDRGQDRRHVTGPTRAVVTTKVKKLERDRDSGGPKSSARTTLAAYLAEWILPKETLRAVRSNTIDGYRNDEAHITAAIGKVRLDRLGPDKRRSSLELSDRAWTDRRQLSSETQRRSQRCSATRSSSSEPGQGSGHTPRQRDQDRAVHHPADGVPLGCSEGDEERHSLTVAMAHGLRQGEVLGLCWDDLDLATGTGTQGVIVIRRQLQRVSWQHGCSDRKGCITKGGALTKRGGRLPATMGRRPKGLGAKVSRRTSDADHPSHGHLGTARPPGRPED